MYSAQILDLRFSAKKLREFVVLNNDLIICIMLICWSMLTIDRIDSYSRLLYVDLRVHSYLDNLHIAMVLLAWTQFWPVTCPGKFQKPWNLDLFIEWLSFGFWPIIHMLLVKGFKHDSCMHESRN